MNIVDINQNKNQITPSIFALLIDDIHRMTESEQKLLWIEINKDKLSALAQALDAQVIPHNLSINQIDNLIDEALKNVRAEKKS